MDKRTAFEAVNSRFEAPQIAFAEAICLYMACVHNDTSLADPSYPSSAGRDAIEEVQACFEEMQLDRRRRGQAVDPSVFHYQEMLKGRAPEFPLETLGAEKVVLEYAEFALEQLIWCQTRNKTGSRTFECLKRWIQLKKWGHTAQTELIRAHHRRQIRLKGARKANARSHERRPIPRSFSFEFPAGRRMVVFDGEVLMAPTPGSIPEVWYDVRISGAGLLKLLSGKTSSLSDEVMAAQCRDFLISIMKPSPNRKTHTIKELWSGARASIPGIAKKRIFDPTRRDLIKKGNSFEAWGKGGPPLKK